MQQIIEGYARISHRLSVFACTNGEHTEGNYPITSLNIPYGTKTLWELNFIVRLSIVWMKSCWDFNFTKAQFRSRSRSDIY